MGRRKGKGMLMKEKNIFSLRIVSLEPTSRVSASFLHEMFAAREQASHTTHWVLAASVYSPSHTSTVQCCSHGLNY